MKKIAPGDAGRKHRMAIVADGQVRMAHLSVVGSHSVNGVAALHTKLLKEKLLNEFAEMYPDRFNNKTNGITPFGVGWWVVIPNFRNWSPHPSVPSG